MRWCKKKLGKRIIQYGNKHFISVSECPLHPESRMTIICEDGSLFFNNTIQEVVSARKIKFPFFNIRVGKYVPVRWILHSELENILKETNIIHIQYNGLNIFYGLKENKRELPSLFYKKIGFM